MKINRNDFVSLPIESRSYVAETGNRFKTPGLEQPYLVDLKDA
jgi:hypothetical protein